jgi:hypothetical protein
MADLVQVYLKESAEEAKYASVKMRRKRVIEGLLEKEDVLEIIQEEFLKNERLKQLGFVRIERLCEEMEALIAQGIHFGQYKNEASLDALDMDKAVAELKTHAPTLAATLGEIMESPLTERRSLEAVRANQYRGAIVASICCYSRGRKNSIYIQNLMGLCL